MSRKTLVAAISIIVCGTILAIGIMDKSEKEHEEFIAEIDRKIEMYERTDYDKDRKQVEETLETLNEDGMENSETEKTSEQGKVYVTPIETYCDPTTAEYEQNGLGLAEYEFYEAYSAIGNVTWEDCVVAAVNQFGMDEYTLRICSGWLVNEDYTSYDAYLSYLCANCPWYYFTGGYNVADGLAGWDYTGNYSEDRLVCLSYYISQEELNVLYLAITNPYYNICGSRGQGYHALANAIIQQAADDYISWKLWEHRHQNRPNTLVVRHGESALRFFNSDFMPC